MAISESLSTTTRLILGTGIALLALLLLVSGWTIPFYFESQSILYKFGLEKTFLRSGKMIGITIAILIFFQIILASRFTIFEQVFSVKRLLSLHRINGKIITLLIVSHPVLIKASEKFTPYTFEKKYYPEFIGIALLALLLIVSFTAIFRNFIKMPYTWWLFLHRLGVTLVFLIMPAHILFVSETFKSGIPRSAALIVFSLNLVMLAWIWVRRLLQKKSR